MALSDLDQHRVARHLGYMLVRAAAGPGFAWPTMVAIQFPVYGPLQNLMPDAEGMILDLLTKLDTTREQLFGSQENLDALAIGDITLNPRQIAQLRGAYRYWVRELSMLTAIAPAPDHPLMGGGGMNIPRV